MMNRLHRKFVNEAYQKQELLTDWEVDFIINIVRKDIILNLNRNASYDLTKKENHKLNEISQKYIRTGW